MQRKPQELMDMLNNYVMPVHFQNFRFDGASFEAMIPGGKWDYSYLLETGYDGCVLLHMRDTPVFTQWEELAALVANLALKRK